jgi:hypothetical protein
MQQEWWIVSHYAGLQDSLSDDADELTQVELAQSWATAKMRFAELVAEGREAYVSDEDGEIVRAHDFCRT